MTEHSKEVMERRREGFEQHYKSRYGMSVSAQYQHDVGYSSYAVDERWITWNAALDSVVIELPEKFGDDHGGDSHHAGIHDDAVDEFRLAIESTAIASAPVGH